ncbi:hypothetical protein QQ045_002564 [Rhodiola kirilowii]
MNRVTGPWIWSGDFNSLRLHCEKLNGARVKDSDVRDIASLCDNNGLSDITFSGCFYTWSDRHTAGDRIWSKLDRILVNDDMMHLFPRVMVCFRIRVFLITPQRLHFLTTCCSETSCLDFILFGRVPMSSSPVWWINGEVGAGICFCFRKG